MEQKFATALAIAKAKNSDYTGGKDPFSNLKACEQLLGISTEKGILVRMTDKIARISTLLTNEAQVKDESIQDSILDICNYAIILSNYIDSKK